MQNYIKKTLEYYENNAEDYANQWTDDFLKNYDFTIPDIFLRYLQDGDSILDLGCGPGRDSKFFLEHGYKVTAIDGSKKFCDMASKILNIPVTNINFLDMDYNEEFAGVFACASLLHLENQDLIKVLESIHKALKKDGILYCSFKKGAGTRLDAKNRFYNDMNEEKFKALINDLPTKYKILKTWEGDQYKSHKKFINFILRKN